MLSRFRPNTLMVGYSDSAVRAWDLSTFQCVRRIALDAKDVYVWKIVELKYAGRHNRTQ